MEGRRRCSHRALGWLGRLFAAPPRPARTIRLRLTPAAAAPAAVFLRCTRCRQELLRCGGGLVLGEEPLAAGRVPHLQPTNRRHRLERHPRSANELVGNMHENMLETCMKTC